MEIGLEWMGLFWLILILICWLWVCFFVVVGCLISGNVEVLFIIDICDLLNFVVRCIFFVIVIVCWVDKF